MVEANNNDIGAVVAGSARRLYVVVIVVKPRKRRGVRDIWRSLHIVFERGGLSDKCLKRRVGVARYNNVVARPCVKTLIGCVKSQSLVGCFEPANERRDLGALLNAIVGDNRNSRKNGDNNNNDQQFHNRKTARGFSHVFTIAGRVGGAKGLTLSVKSANVYNESTKNKKHGRRRHNSRTNNYQRRF